MSSGTRSAQDWELREWEAEFSVPDDQTWKQMVIDDLCGGKYAVNGAAVLNKLLLDFHRYLNTPALVKYLVDKCLLTDGEKWALTVKPLGPQEKTLQLQQILMKKGENALFEFYLCLLESYGLEPGLKEHYILVQIIKRKVRFHDCSDMAELLQQEREPVQVVRQIKLVTISSETARSLIQKLHLDDCNLNIENVTTQEIAKHWLATDKTKDWRVLVEALLTEPGCGCSVSGVLPLSECNPPDVWHFVRKLCQNWVHFAKFLGFRSRLIRDIKCAWSHDPMAQINSFMRTCLIPDCGDEKIRAIIQQINHHLPVCRDTLITTKAKRSVSEDEKEDMPSEMRALNFGDWNAQGPVVVFQFHDFQKVIRQQTYPGASRGYQGGAALTAGGTSELYADDENGFSKDNSAGYDTLRASRCQETAGENEVKPQDLKASQPTLSRQQSIDVHSVSEDDSGRDILQACILGNWDFVKESVSPRSNLEASNKNGRTALHLCCIKGNTEIAKLLLQNGADVTTVDNEGNCCLHFRETLKNENLVEVLVEEFKSKNSTLDQLDNNGLTPLMVACLTNSDLCTKSVIHLITSGAAIDGPPDAYSAPLIHASAVGNKRMVETLLLYGANINKQDQDGSTALIQVCLCNQTDIAIMLLEAGADVNKAEKNGTAALAAAITRNSFEMVQKLLEKGANPNAIRVISGEVEETPLAFTCAHGLRDIAHLLIVQGAKVNYMCSRQVPAIGFAIIGRQQGMVEFMLQVEDFNKSVYGLAIPMHIAMSVENLEAATAVLNVLGGPQRALELAQDKNHLQFKQDISFFIAVCGDAVVTSQCQPTTSSYQSESRNHLVKVQQTLQTFSQICMSAIMTNRELEVIVDCATIDDLPHVAMFFREYFDIPQRADILKANFLSRDHGVSPLNFSIERGIINSDDFQVHALEFFPEGPHQFYTDLVWSFYQISGEEDLTWDVPSVLQRLFSGSFSRNVGSSVADTQTQNYSDANQADGPLPGATGHHQSHVASLPISTAPQPSTLSSTTSDANHTLNPITCATADARPHVTSTQPMSQPSTLVNTTYDAPQTFGPISRPTTNSEPHMASSVPISTASQPPTLLNASFDAQQNPRPMPMTTANNETQMTSLPPMSTASQPPALSNTAYDALSPVPRARGTTDYQPQLTSSPPMSTASQPPTTYDPPGLNGWQPEKQHEARMLHRLEVDIPMHAKGEECKQLMAQQSGTEDNVSHSSEVSLITSPEESGLPVSEGELRQPISRQLSLPARAVNRRLRFQETPKQKSLPSRIPVPKRYLSDCRYNRSSSPFIPRACAYTPNPRTRKKVYANTTEQHSTSRHHSYIQVKHATTFSGQAVVSEEPSSTPKRGMQTHNSGSLDKHSRPASKRVNMIGQPSRIPRLNRPLSDPQQSMNNSPSKPQSSISTYTPSPKTEKRMYDFTTQRSIPHSHCRPVHSTKLSRQTAIIVKEQSCTPKLKKHAHSLPGSSTLPKHSSQTPQRANTIDAMSSTDGLEVPDNPLTIYGSTIQNKPISDIEKKFRVLSNSKLNWCSLAWALRLTDEIDKLKCFQEEERCYQMLCYWKIKFHEQATYSKLARALVYTSQEGVIRKECRQVFSDDL